MAKIEIGSPTSYAGSYAPSGKGFLSTSLLLTIFLFLLLFGAGSALVSYSASSLPGTLLYPLKLTVEDAKTLFAEHPRDTAVLYKIYLEERTQEMEKVALTPSPVYNKRSLKALLATGDTINEIIAGLSTGEMYFDYDTVSSSLSTLEKVPPSLNLLEENLDETQVFLAIDNLRGKVALLDAKLKDVENKFTRNIDL